MAKSSEYNVEPLYKIAETWRDECLIKGKSLLWKDEPVWTLENLNTFKRCFIDKPDESSDSFDIKFRKQLAGEGPDVTKLACELLLIYFLFPSTVGGSRKREVISQIAGWKDLKIEDFSTQYECLNEGIGSAGLAYNTRRPFEISYLALVAIEIVSLALEERTALLSDHLRTRDLLEKVQGDDNYQTLDILLHLLFPLRYERIASKPHKRHIVAAFSGLLDKANIPEALNDKLFAIRTRLEELLSVKSEKLDFYWPPLRQCWYESSDSDGLNPLDALEIKKQIVFYGPPGTGKTHDAKELADKLIRKALLEQWKPHDYFTKPEAVSKLILDRIRRVQFHPGFGYEDLIRGLQIGDNGKTEYRNGVLLQLVEELKAEPPELRRIPFVLILDEMNRTDLSKVLGECFSMLEDRASEIELAGHDRRNVRLPENLHFIGTMNLIDLSLEHVDFALRRRFLWFFRGFDKENFSLVCRYRWDLLKKDGRISKPWSRFSEEFEELAKRAAEVNARIGSHPSLGHQYHIGHTYFCDVVYFAEKSLQEQPRLQNLLFGRKGSGREPISVLWTYSLRPLLEQYLSGTEKDERDRFVRELCDVIMQGVKEE